MTSDEEIIESVLRGGVDRYGELVERYQQSMWRLAYSMVGNFEDAKEISQNGFFKAYRHLAGFRRSARFSTWLYRIIINECKDFFRRKGRRPAFVQLSSDPESEEAVLFEVADPRGDPSDVVAQRELAEALSQAIERLPMKQKTAFVLHRLQGMSIEEISQVMGCRRGTVKAHLFRASEHLRILMEPFVKEEAHR